jgi:hypothetical protein
VKHGGNVTPAISAMRPEFELSIASSATTTPPACRFAIAVKAASNSAALRASKYEISSFIDLAALSMSLFSVTDEGLSELTRKAAPARRGMIAFSSSSRLTLCSGPKTVDPVTFPPRQAGDEARSHRVAGDRHDDGNRRGRALGRESSRRSRSHEDVYLEANQLGREVGKTIVVPVGPAELDDQILALRVADSPEPSPEGFHPARESRR